MTKGNGLPFGSNYKTETLNIFLNFLRSKKKTDGTKLVQCRLLEPQLRHNPLYAPPGSEASHYQISTLQHHYERINSLSRSQGQGHTESRSRYFYSIPNKKRSQRSSPDEAMKRNGDENFGRVIRRPSGDYAVPSLVGPGLGGGQRPRSVELPPLPFRPRLGHIEQSWSRTYPKLGAHTEQGARESIYDTVSNISSGSSGQDIALGQY